MKISFLLFSCFACLYGCNRLPLSMQDSPIEEMVEDQIKDKTGIEVDLSGDSPEGEKK